MALEVMNPADELLEDQDSPVLFMMKSDIYAFGMTAFEASPNFLSTISESLIISDPVRGCSLQNGQLCDLLRACWQYARLPSIPEGDDSGVTGPAGALLELRTRPSPFCGVRCWGIA
jgi:hypothetical protein